MAYKNILENEIAEFNKLYKLVCKRCPSESIVEKQKMTLSGMLLMRCPQKDDITRTMMNPFENSKTWQRMVEIIAVTEELSSLLRVGESLSDSELILVPTNVTYRYDNEDEIATEMSDNDIKSYIEDYITTK